MSASLPNLNFHPVAMDYKPLPGDTAEPVCVFHWLEGNDCWRCHTRIFNFPPLRCLTKFFHNGGGRIMGKLRVAAFSISLDGYAAGPRQDLANPMGQGGMALHSWVFKTHSFQDTHGQAGSGVGGVDNDFATRAMDNLGAWILGRNMFGPVRGPWPDDSWRGWWGENPPYHVPVYVLTHHPKPDLVMDGDNTFHFITGGIHEALRLARAAAGDKDVRVGGGAQTVREYLRAGLIDEMHLAVSPVLLGKGEALLAGLDLPALGYRVSAVQQGEGASHVLITRGP